MVSLEKKQMNSLLNFYLIHLHGGVLDLVQSRVMDPQTIPRVGPVCRLRTSLMKGSPGPLEEGPQHIPQLLYC